MTPDRSDGPPRAVLIAALAVAALAVVALLVIAAVRQTPQQPRPVIIASAPAPDADGEACRALRDALPDQLGDYQRATLADPAPVGAAGWQAGGDTDPVILRCGVDRPIEFVAGAPVQAVDDVDWFRIGGQGRSTWIAVGRPVYVALTLPDGSGPTAIQLISQAVASVMPRVPVDPGPVR